MQSDSLSAKLFALIQYPLPHHFLSRIMLRLTRCKIKRLKNFAIKKFIKAFKVDMSLAVEEAPEKYQSFNDFFTRALKAEARPLALGENNIISPVDGAISQMTAINNNTIVQAKGQGYSVESLLGDSDMAKQFENGNFTTLYLSPRDYHRIHMPVDGTLKKVIHVPGRLFSVNPATVHNVPALFARNERVVCFFETPVGPMAFVLVGAIFVASIETVWQGEITPPTHHKIRSWDHTTNPVNLKQGEEMGRFNMGSTVIMLFAKDAMKWLEEHNETDPVQMGQLIGKKT
jgi:phosphatidylserine decarboxylase